MNPNLAAEHCFESSNINVVNLPPRRTLGLNWKSRRNKIRQFTNLLLAVLWIRDVYLGSDFFPSRIQDLTFFHPGTGSRIRIKEFKYFNPKTWFLSSMKHDLGCSSRIRIPDPRVKKAPDPESGSATLNFSNTVDK
jgi:hypothetical protein